MRVLDAWAPALWLTYVGAAGGAVGLVAAVTGHPSLACALLVVAGLADLFDGPLARRLHRDPRSRRMGEQVDSLADVVSFVALPVGLAATLVPSWWVAVVAVPYVVCGLARLTYFGAEQVTGRRTHYRGVPVTYAALVIPLAALVARPVVVAALGVLAVAYVIDVRVPKPHGRSYALLAVVAVLVLTLLGTAGVR